MAKLSKNILYLGINEQARKVFDYIVSESGNKIQKSLDFGQVAIYSRTAVQLTKCYEFEQTLEGNLFYTTDKGNLAAHPIRDEISMLEKRLTTSGDRLGLSPASRRKIFSMLTDDAEESDESLENQYS